MVFKRCSKKGKEDAIIDPSIRVTGYSYGGRAIHFEIYNHEARMSSDAVTYQLEIPIDVIFEAAGKAAINLEKIMEPYEEE